MTKLLAPREPMKPVLVFDPNVPENVRYADTPRKLSVYYAQGFQKVKPKRLGHILAQVRQKLALDINAMVAVLAQHGLEITPYALEQLEKGTPPNDFTVHFVKTLAAALNISVGELVHKNRRLSRGIRPADVRHITELAAWKVQGHVEDRAFDAVVLAHDSDEAKEMVRSGARSAAYNASTIRVDEVKLFKMKPRCVHFATRPH